MKLETITKSAGGTVVGVEGTFGKIYPRKTGENSFGTWSMQSGSLRLEDGEVKVLFDGCPDNSALSNQAVSITSVKGLKVEWNEYQGKKTLQVRVKANDVTGAMAETAAGGVAPIRKATTPQVTQSRNAVTVESIENAIRFWCGRFEVDLSDPENARQLAISCFIEANRAGLSAPRLKAVEKLEPSPTIGSRFEDSMTTQEKMEDSDIPF